jgi:hypothetical protein
MKIKSIAIVACLLSAFSCNSKSNSNQEVNKTVTVEKEHNPMENQSVETQIDALKQSMTDYLASAHPIYTEREIASCVNILSQFKVEMTNSGSKEAGMQIVKTAVLKLNELNEKSGGDLIETGEREAIASIIITAGNKKGYNSMDEDITEKWREW